MVFFLLGLADVDIPSIFECMAHIVAYFNSSCSADVADLHEKT